MRGIYLGGLCAEGKYGIDCSSLKAQSHLRYLSLCCDGAFEIASLPESGELRYLRYLGSQPRNMSAFSHQRGLRTLILGHDEEEVKGDELRISDVAPLGQLRALRLLDIRRTPVRDLTPLSALPELVGIEAAYSDVDALGTEGFASRALPRGRDAAQQLIENRTRITSPRVHGSCDCAAPFRRRPRLDEPSPRPIVLPDDHKNSQGVSR